MHYETSLLYEGPPCSICQQSMFIGTCTHRPRKLPEPIKLPPEVEEEIRLVLAQL